MRTLLPIRLRQRRQTPQIPNNILRLPKIHLLQQIPHLQLHILNQLANVSDMASVIVDREIGFDLPRHVAGEVHGAEGVVGGREVEDYGGGELVVGGAGAVDGFEDVDAVPGSFGLGVWCCNLTNVSSFSLPKNDHCLSQFMPLCPVDTEV